MFKFYLINRFIFLLVVPSLLIVSGCSMNQIEGEYEPQWNTNFDDLANPVVSTTFPRKALWEFGPKDGAPGEGYVFCGESNARVITITFHITENGRVEGGGVMHNRKGENMIGQLSFAFYDVNDDFIIGQPKNLSTGNVKLGKGDARKYTFKLHSQKWISDNFNFLITPGIKIKGRFYCDW